MFCIISGDGVFGAISLQKEMRRCKKIQCIWKNLGCVLFVIHCRYVRSVLVSFLLQNYMFLTFPNGAVDIQIKCWIWNFVQYVAQMEKSCMINFDSCCESMEFGRSVFKLTVLYCVFFSYMFLLGLRKVKENSIFEELFLLSRIVHDKGCLAIRDEFVADFDIFDMCGLYMSGNNKREIFKRVFILSESICARLSRNWCSYSEMRMFFFF